MKLKRFLANETGFMLLENIITLTIIAMLLISIYPLIAEWLMIREDAKVEVEQARVLYETSLTWPEKSPSHEKYRTKLTDSSITVQHKNKTMGVEIYASQFE